MGKRLRRKRLPPLPSFVQLFVNFLWCILILHYDYMYTETDFTQEKGHFHSTSRIPNSSLLFAAALSQNGRIAVKWRHKGHEKCIF